jgi:hypothetical protein
VSRRAAIDRAATSASIVRGDVRRHCQRSPNFPQLGSSNFPHLRVAVVTRRIRSPQP